MIKKAAYFVMALSSFIHAIIPDFYESYGSLYFWF